MRPSDEVIGNVFGATLSRRRFVKAGGALAVAVSVPTAIRASAGTAAGAPLQLDATKAASWLEIRADNTIVMRTGKAELGQGSASGAYAQIVAEELDFPYDAISVVMGSTDVTPDGGTSAGFILKAKGSPWPEPFGGGGLNLQRVSAYTRQALLDLAATRLGLPKAQLSVKDGVVSGGGKTVTYGQLVAGQQLNLTIPTTGAALTSNLNVTGNPPVKPTSQFKVIGKSYPMKTIPDIVTGKTVWTASVRLPGMLHARVVKPPTLGSTLVSVGKLDKKAFPNVQVVVKGNLVAAVAPAEYEAIQAASVLATKTKWTDWKELPGSGNLFKAMRAADYSVSPTTNGPANKGQPATAFAAAARKLTATYTVPFVKHAPIGPSIAVADVRGDGTVHIWTTTQKAQALRGFMANMLGISADNVAVHWTAGTGAYGRSNGGTDGCEAEAVILSQAVGKPVRLQWMRPEDMQWSTQSHPLIGDMQVGLDANGNMVSFQGDYFIPGRRDERPVGALLTGMPTPAGEPFLVHGVSTEWPYDKVPNVGEFGRSSAQIGQAASPIKVGLRIHSMRTPVHRQENTALEGIVNEAAAAARVDPIEYRLRHTADPRLIAVLNELKRAHGWETRPSPRSDARTTGSEGIKGQGMSVMLRINAYWASAADITVSPQTGKITVDSYTLVVEPGIIVNPFQLRRNMEGGTIQGISETLHEAMAFDKSKVLSSDWVTYPILRMKDAPRVKVAMINRPDLNVVGMGGEAPNGLPQSTLMAALHDATGVMTRTLPLRPAFVRSLLGGGEKG
jgi:CO/xanthine dehydrogenase Mo-binding subunit